QEARNALCTGGAMRVLVIEDNADLREYLRVALEAQKYEVLTAGHGQQALAYLNGHRVDAIVTDLFMPEMDGIETVATVRKLDADGRVYGYPELLDRRRTPSRRRRERYSSEPGRGRRQADHETRRL